MGPSSLSAQQRKAPSFWTVSVAFWPSSLLPHEGCERYADAVQHRRVLTFHTLSFRPLETRRVQLPVVQDLDLLLPGKGRVMNHRIGVLEQVGRIVQRPLQIDLTHLDLRSQVKKAEIEQKALILLGSVARAKYSNLQV